MNGSARPSPSAAAGYSHTTETKPIDIPTLSKASRTLSSSSDACSTRPRSPSSSLSSSLRKSPSSWLKASPTVNVHTTCGRHTDQYFFGGPSLTELARSVMKKS
ncbi:hypothetical protein HRG_002152 [Hirsutella rhossiliensis]|uniref:Uncharacterized protein n=1 Tax=Hirsutella rhossiliensis TaxID=111463 RepID=A0A9P8N1Y7_9HYPO|nr:uncharacterized protein HRG_02152 [Hirsutella rhossiliensis]KAH0966743.1 hypothetical protein HRG_02152 [Hirsutella rhossiliensis]